jgi:hypothetical protein
MDESPWEANRFSASQESPAFYGTRKFVTAFTPPAPILNQIDPVHAYTSPFLKIHRNMVSPPFDWIFQVVSLPQVLSHQNPVYTSPLSIRGTCPAHAINITRKYYLLINKPTTFCRVWWSGIRRIVWRSKVPFLIFERLSLDPSSVEMHPAPHSHSLFL